ncbi:Nuclear transport factor 2 [Monascus purpureus]|uniref:Nuclear transport factor 2 n=1 Tax=Monascus purpureus TaxID=5098 RepID=A0A507QZ10_MONPU|nr:Nuclear transport factor 2 [Monascus purpureus]
MADFTSVAQQFVQFYYQTFDSNRAGLAGLYRDQSMLTFETSSVQGVAGIVEKLTNLPFQKVVHQVATFDAQPSSDAGGILVMVTGALLVDDEQKPMSYTQSFQLLPDGQGSYFVFNDIFRLIYSAA